MSSSCSSSGLFLSCLSLVFNCLGIFGACDVFEVVHMAERQCLRATELQSYRMAAEACLPGGAGQDDLPWHTETLTEAKVNGEVR